MSDTKFIEIDRVLSDDDKNNVSSEKETIDINSIRSFRVWHKGKKDEKIDGDMTLIILKPDVNSTAIKPRTMLIKESYESFIGRVGHKASLRRIDA